jgi:3-mercaptopyruvate sulfurtransferase SseA
MILVMSRSVAQGPSAGVATAAGVSAGLVAYDNMGFPLGSARLWWALSYYGHDRVRVLDGGLRE